MFSKKWLAEFSSLKSIPRFLSRDICSAMEWGILFTIPIKKMTRQQILRYAERVLLIQNYNNFYISQIFLSCFLVQT